MNKIKKNFVTLYLKIVLGIGITMITAVILASYLYKNYFYDYIQNNTEKEISTILDSVNLSSSILIQNKEFSDLQRLTESIGASSFIREITIYNTGANILASNRSFSDVNSSNKEFLDDLLSGKKFRYIKSDFSDNILIMAIPVNGSGYNSIENNDIMGVICIKADISAIKGLLTNLNNTFFETAIIVGILILMSILGVVTLKLLIPTSKLYKAAMAVSEGDYNHHIDENTEKEFYPVIKEFNNMTEKIKIRDEELKALHQKLKDHNENLEIKVTERTSELKLTQDITIRSLAHLAETRDNETGSHIFRTQHYVEILAEHLKDNPKFSKYLTSKNIELIFKSAPLHDIGKVGIPDSILLKPSGLTKEEFEIMKKHTVYGRDTIIKSENFIGNNSFLAFAKEIAYSHHEKWDGTGYPEGLAGEEIPISARLMAIADVYDALVSVRPYKKAFTHEEAVRIILEGDGRTSPNHFDPDILAIFSKIHNKFNDVYIQHPDAA